MRSKGYAAIRLHNAIYNRACQIILLLLICAPIARAQTSFDQSPEQSVQLKESDTRTQPKLKRVLKNHPENSVKAAETRSSPSWIPRPILFLGPSLVGNGYQTLAANLGGGLLLNSSKLLSDVEAYYMNAKKVDDNTLRNSKGHERFLQGRLFYPWRKGIYFGGGAQWSETATTNYTKKAWRPTFGVGGDHLADDWSCRWQVLYVTKGTDRSNGLQGPEIQLWIPSPLSKSHFFFRQSLGVYRFHETVTDPSNLLLTAQQTGTRYFGSFLDFSFGWRF